MGKMFLTEMLLDILNGGEFATWVEKYKGIKTKTHKVSVKWEYLPIVPSAQACNLEVLGLSDSCKPTLVHLKVMGLTRLHQILYSSLYFCDAD